MGGVREFSVTILRNAFWIRAIDILFYIHNRLLPSTCFSRFQPDRITKHILQQFRRTKMKIKIDSNLVFFFRGRSKAVYTHTTLVPLTLILLYTISDATITVFCFYLFFFKVVNATHLPLDITT